MGFKEIVQKMMKGREEKNRLYHQMNEEYQAKKLIMEREKSSNERELERFQNEEREEIIKERLEHYRKKKDNDIRFNHNPLDVPNITSKTKWNVLKEKNQFTNNGCMFVGQKNIHQSNPKLLNNNRSLYGI